MIIDIPQGLALRLGELAEERGSTVEEICCVAWWIKKCRRRQRTTLADLAEIAVSAGLASDKPVDTAERSREILETEYTDYLKRHQTESPTSRDSAGQQIPRQN